MSPVASLLDGAQVYQAPNLHLGETMRDFELEVFFAKWEFEAQHHLTASDAQSMTLDDLLAMASQEDRDAFGKLWLGYRETQGDEALREAIAKTYKNLKAEHIQCFAGAQEGIYAAMKTLLTPADHALVVVPNYQAAETLPLDICEVTGIPLREDHGWTLDLQALEDAIKPNTRLVSINFPNNPTGAIPSHEDFQSLVEICRKHDLYLFSDEVYRGLEDPKLRIPQAADVYEKGLSLNVMSKSYGLPGLRVGWLASPDTEALAACNRYKHYLSICNPGPSEHLAMIALRARDKILARNRALIVKNLHTLNDFFARHPDLFDWAPPQGGCVAYPKWRGSCDVELFCKRLLLEARVLLLPASIYRSELIQTPPDRFRIGCGRQDMNEGLEAMDAWLVAQE